MRAIAELFTRFNAPGASRWLIATSLVLLTAWLQAHIVLAALHDDGTTVRSAIAVYNDDAVRGQVTDVVDWALAEGATLTGAGADADAVRGAVVTALGSGQISAPVADALVSGLLGLRDDALAQFAQSGPTSPRSWESRRPPSWRSRSSMRRRSTRCARAITGRSSSTAGVFSSPQYWDSPGSSSRRDRFAHLRSRSVWAGWRASSPA